MKFGAGNPVFSYYDTSGVAFIGFHTNGAPGAGGFSFGGATPTFRFGRGDSASPYGQIFNVDSVVAGTINTAGAAFSEYDSAGTGSGLTGGYNWYTHPSGAGATVQNTAVLGMTLGIAGVNALNVIGGYYVNSTKGVTCSGALTVVSSITITGGIITAATGTGGTCS
jgi:hypothetical protein